MQHAKQTSNIIGQRHVQTAEQSTGGKFHPRSQSANQVQSYNPYSRPRKTTGYNTDVQVLNVEEVTDMQKDYLTSKPEGIAES